MKLKPDCGLLPWLAAILTIVGAGGRMFIPAQNSFLSAFFFGIVVVFALVLAYLGWQCNAERQLPSSDVCELLLHLDRIKFFNGTPAEFNVEAQKVLYSDEMAGYILQPTDFCSSLRAAGYIKFVDVSAIGTPQQALYIVLIDKAKKVVKHLQKAVKAAS